MYVWGAARDTQHVGTEPNCLGTLKAPIACKGTMKFVYVDFESIAKYLATKGDNSHVVTVKDAREFLAKFVQQSDIDSMKNANLLITHGAMDLTILRLCFHCS